MCERLRQVALSLSLYSIPAFVTDPYNRFIWANSEFVRVIGDPLDPAIPPDGRIIHLLVVGAFKDRFAQPVPMVASCLSALVSEVEAGHLVPETMRLIDQGVRDHADLRRALAFNSRPWDGTVAIKASPRRLFAIREQVTAVADPDGRPTGFHISLWFPAGREREMVPEVSGPHGDASSRLTTRQLEIARLFVSGMNSRQVAERAGTSIKTARAHLEEIYHRLNIHSRAQLAAILVREGIV